MQKQQHLSLPQSLPPLGLRREEAAAYIFPLYERGDLDVWASARLSPKVQKNAELRVQGQAT
jgi:hypothetical protein